MVGFNATPFDYQTEMQRLKARQAVTQAMMGGALKPLDTNQMAGNMVVPVSPLAALAKVAEGGLTGYMSKANDDKAAEIQKQFRADTAQGMQRYFDTLNGTAGADGKVLPGNERQAVLEALSSTNPMLQALGQEQMKEMNKNRVGPKDMLPYATPDSILTSPNDPTKWAAKRELKSVTPGEVLVDAAGNVTQPGGMSTQSGGTTGAGNSQPYELVTINGDLYMKTATGLKKLDNAPKITNNTNVTVSNRGQNELLKTFGEKGAQNLDALGKAAQNALNTKRTIANMRETDASGVFSNVTSGASTWLSSLGQSFGLPVDQTKLGNTEYMNSLSGDLSQRIIAAYGGNRGVTKEEADQIRMIVPQAVHSPQARAKLYDMLDKASDQHVRLFQDALKSAKQAAQSGDPGGFLDNMEATYLGLPSQPTAGAQAPATGGTPQVIPVEDWLKTLGSNPAQ